MTRSQRDSCKRFLHNDCAELGLAVSENATIRQLHAALDAYRKDAVVVHVGGKACLRQTDRPTAEYTVEFTIRGYHTVRAESEDAARNWAL